MNVLTLLRAVGRGETTFDDVLKKIHAATFTGRQATRGDWGAVWDRAEEGPGDDDVPEAVHTATYAGYITKEQGKQLLDIWTAKVTPPA